MSNLITIEYARKVTVDYDRPLGDAVRRAGIRHNLAALVQWLHAIEVEAPESGTEEVEMVLREVPGLDPFTASPDETIARLEEIGKEDPRLRPATQKEGLAFIEQEPYFAEQYIIAASGTIFGVRREEDTEPRPQDIPCFFNTDQGLALYGLFWLIDQQKEEDAGGLPPVFFLFVREPTPQN